MCQNYEPFLRKRHRWSQIYKRQKSYEISRLRLAFFVKDQFLTRKSGTLQKVNKRKLSHLFSSKQDSQSQSATRLPLFQYFSSDKNLPKLIKVIDVFLSRNHDHLKPQWRKILHLWNILDVIQWPTSNLGRKYDWGASKTTVSAAY